MQTSPKCEQIVAAQQTRTPIPDDVLEAAGMLNMMGELREEVSLLKMRINKAIEVSSEGSASDAVQAMLEILKPDED